MSLQRPVIEGVFCTFGTRQFEYLRFYADGFVMSITVVVKHGDAIEAWVQVQHWFHREQAADRAFSSGHWSLEESQIHFTTLSPEGTVDYNGSFLGDHMVLDIYNDTNGASYAGTIYYRLTT